MSSPRLLADRSEAIVRTHPQLGIAAQRSLLSAARALVASGSTVAPSTHPAIH